MFIVEKFVAGPIGTNTYIIACPSAKQAIIIDPGFGSCSFLLNFLSKHFLQCSSILLTHSHWDHIADVSKLKQRASFPVLVHELDAKNLEKPGSDGLIAPMEISPVSPDNLLTNNQQIICGSLSFRVLHTPGHSPGSICLYEEKMQLLFSGDTLFKGSMGNISFPHSQPDNMWISLQQLAMLPAATTVYPGHGPSTTIGQESHWLTCAKQIFQND